MKKIILILITLLLTGCAAKYEINIDQDKIYDNIEIYEDSTIFNNKTDKENKELNELILDWERGYDFYKKELFTTDKITGYRYQYDFSFDEYTAMSQLRKCYDDFELTNQNNITLKTSKEFLCGDYYPNANEITISITSKYTIIESNADVRSNNIHTWKINKNNYKNKPITITINKNNTYKEDNKKSLLNTKQIIIILLFIALIIILRIRKKAKI